MTDQTEQNDPNELDEELPPERAAPSVIGPGGEVAPAIERNYPDHEIPPPDPPQL